MIVGVGRPVQVETNRLEEAENVNIKSQHKVRLKEGEKLYIFMSFFCATDAPFPSHWHNCMPIVLKAHRSYCQAGRHGTALCQRDEPVRKTEKHPSVSEITTSLKRASQVVYINTSAFFLRRPFLSVFYLLHVSRDNDGRRAASLVVGRLVLSPMHVDSFCCAKVVVPKILLSRTQQQKVRPSVYRKFRSVFNGVIFRFLSSHFMQRRRYSQGQGDQWSSTLPRCSEQALLTISSFSFLQFSRTITWSSRVLLPPVSSPIALCSLFSCW